MTKIDIVDKLYEKLNLPKKEVDKVVESVFDIIKEKHYSGRTNS